MYGRSMSDRWKSVVRSFSSKTYEEKKSSIRATTALGVSDIVYRMSRAIHTRPELLGAGSNRREQRDRRSIRINGKNVLLGI